MPGNGGKFKPEHDDNIVIASASEAIHVCHSGARRKTRTRNLEIPGLVLTHHPGMTDPSQERAMPSATERLQHLYERFNARDIEAVLAILHSDVMWANGMEGGHVHGHDGVRTYWTRQWAMINPRVEPTGFSAGADGAFNVRVHQTVRDLDGKLLSDKTVVHIFRIEDGLIRRFDIGSSQ
jgi:limonene-1,2-epoxide hydrolase